MSLTLPASIQELVGRRILRISTNWPDRDIIIFDTTSTPTTRRTRYAYTIDGTFDRAWRLGSMVGYIVTEITALDEESNGQQKMVIKTDGSHGFGVLYFSLVVEEGLLTEEGDDWVQEGDEDCPCLLVESEVGEDVELVDLTVGRNPPYNDAEQYIVQEDDVDYGKGITGTCPCEED